MVNDSGWVAEDAGAGRHVLHHDRAGADHRAVADVDAGQDGGVWVHDRVLTDSCAATDEGHCPDLRVVADMDIVTEHGVCLHVDEVAQPHVGAELHAVAQEAALADVHVRAQERAGDDGDEVRALLKQWLRIALARMRIADRADERSSLRLV